MSISSRIHDTINEWAEEWRDRLRGWLANALGLGIETFADVIGKAAAPKLAPLIASLEATGKVPPELQPLLNEIKNPTGEVGAMLAQSAGGALVGGAVGKILDGILLPLAYAVNNVTQNVILNAQQYIVLYLRGVISNRELSEKLKWQGLSDAEITQLKELSQVRFSPDAVTKLWLRDKPTYEHFWQDLRDSGVSEDRIEGFQELAYVLPSPQELVLWAAKEVFEPEMIEHYGLMDEFDKLDLSLFEKVGVRLDMAKNNWIAHWQHPAFRELTQMYHRGEIALEDMQRWFRLVEIPPFWREKLINIAWDLPNRIELRMMARYGLVDKSFLVEQLRQVGLKEEYRSIAADMMLAMGIRTDIATRYGKGWIDSEGVRAALVESGLDTQIQDKMYQWIVKNTSTERIAKERDLTVTDIIKGVKKGTISRIEGQSLLQQMGYDKEEAKFKLDINVPVEDEIAEVKQRELTKADILNAYKVGKIDEAEVIQRLMSIRYKGDDAQFLLDLTNATLEAIPEVRERDLTKADIIKGVKAGVISQEEGYIMLITIGYDSSESDFILTVAATAEAGSPDTYNEFLAMTQGYRASQGLLHKLVSLDIIQAERDVKATQAGLKVAKDMKAKHERIQELELAVEEAKQRYHQLLAQKEAKS